MINNKIPFILASTSPRRRELLGLTQIPFEVSTGAVDETPKKSEKPGHLVKRLAREKAIAGALNFFKTTSHNTGWVLGADTIVVLGKKILGKPANPADAVRMVKFLQGKTHLVYSGYFLALLTGEEIRKSVTRTLVTRVSLRKLSQSEIENYVSTGEPLDKAGAYAAQGIGMSLIQSISGSYTNVVGLPISQVIEDLKKYRILGPSRK